MSAARVLAVLLCVSLAAGCASPGPPEEIAEGGVVGWSYRTVVDERAPDAPIIEARVRVEDFERPPATSEGRGWTIAAAFVPFLGPTLPATGESVNTVGTTAEPGWVVRDGELEELVTRELAARGSFAETARDMASPDLILSGEFALEREVYTHFSGLGILMATIIPMLVLPIGKLDDAGKATLRVTSADGGDVLFERTYVAKTSDQVWMANADLELRNYGQYLVPQLVESFLDDLEDPETARQLTPPPR